MARPRVARTKEDIAAVPSGQPIQIELSPEGEVIVPPDSKGVPTQTGGQPPQQLPVEVVAAEPPPKRKDDSEVTTLKSQLEQLKKSSDEALRLAQQEKADLLRRYEARDTDYQTAVSAKSQAELDAIENGIAAAQADAESAERDATAFAEAADWGGHSKAQARIARAHSRLAQLEGWKNGLESRIDRAKQEAEMRQRQPQPSGDPVEDWISRMQGVNESQKNWLRQHRELVTDNEKNARLQVAHFDAQKANKVPGSDDYFQFIEERLGYRQAQAEDEDEEITQRPQIVSAPPTREAPSATGRTSPTRVTLTASEREIAAASGIDEITYARNKLKMMQMKQEGHYKE